MRLFLLGLLLLNIAYFFVPENGVGAQSEVVYRGDRRVSLLLKLDEQPAQVKAGDGISRQLDIARDVTQHVHVSQAGAGVGSPEVKTSKVSTVDAEAAPAQGGRCFTVGPFRRETKAELMTAALQKAGFKVDWRTSKERRTRGYSVFLPSYPSYEAAEAVVKKLSEQGVKDYYILTDATRRNSISLGFFTLKAGSEKRVARLKSMGYSPQVEVRFDEIRVFWLDYESPTAQASETFWQQNPTADNVELLPRECK